VDDAAGRRRPSRGAPGRIDTLSGADRPVATMTDSEADATEAEATAGADATTEAAANGVDARYRETDDERVLEFERDGVRASVAQNRSGYAMLAVRGPGGDERERYYGFDMALDHVAELLGVSPHDLPVPEAASDMGM